MATLEKSTPVLYGVLLGTVLSDIIPTPGDALYFHFHKIIRDKWANGELTSGQYWFREGLIYYTLNSAWWAVVGLAVYYTPGNFQQKLKTGLMVAGSGIAIAVIAKNIQHDNRDKLQEKNAMKTELLNNSSNGQS